MKKNSDFENIAYPNHDQYINVPGKRDTEKWINAVKSIHEMSSNGSDRVSAIKQVTNGWQVVEIFDFLNWIKYYEEGSHLKYKTANLWFENKSPGYFLQVKKPSDSNDAEVTLPKPQEDSNKKEIIEKQRAKIIGRLDSAEKLLRTRDGQLFAGKELESLMEAIYQLKKKIQLINKMSVATRIYSDMIVKEANVLNRKGFSKASNVLYAVAQEITSPATPGVNPMVGGGAPGGLPMNPGMPQDSEDEQAVPFSKGISEFLKRMDSSNLTDTDDLKISDESDSDDLTVEDLETTAQTLPEVTEPLTTSTSPALQNKTQPFVPVEKEPSKDIPVETLKEPEEKALDDIESLPPIGEPIVDEPASDFDAKLDQLMSGITIMDAIIELENLSKIFKTREIPRRLSRADMMLDGLGLAPFFPSLSEAQNKALEANNYIATRVDDILAKLRGSMQTKDIDLQGENDKETTDPQVNNIKNNLQINEDKDKTRRQIKKDQEVAALESKTKPTPEIEVQEDLAAPVPTPVV